MKNPGRWPKFFGKSHLEISTVLQNQPCTYISFQFFGRAYGVLIFNTFLRVKYSTHIASKFQASTIKYQFVTFVFISGFEITQNRSILKFEFTLSRVSERKDADSTKWRAKWLPAASATRPLLKSSVDICCTQTKDGQQFLVVLPASLVFSSSYFSRPSRDEQT